jgi:hypothetical protein
MALLVFLVLLQSRENQRPAEQQQQENENERQGEN